MVTLFRGIQTVGDVNESRVSLGLITSDLTNVHIVRGIDYSRMVQTDMASLGIVGNDPNSAQASFSLFASLTNDFDQYDAFLRGSSLSGNRFEDASLHRKALIALASMGQNNGDISTGIAQYTSDLARQGNFGGNTMTLLRDKIFARMNQHARIRSIDNEEESLLISSIVSDPSLAARYLKDSEPFKSHFQSAFFQEYADNHMALQNLQEKGYRRDIGYGEAALTTFSTATTGAFLWKAGKFLATKALPRVLPMLAPIPGIGWIGAGLFVAAQVGSLAFNLATDDKSREMVGDAAWSAGRGIAYVAKSAGKFVLPLARPTIMVGA